MDLADTHLLQLTIHTHGVATYPAGATYGPRQLRDYQFVWMIEGESVWEVGDHEIPAPIGTVLLGRPRMTDGYRWDARHRTRHGFLHFGIKPHEAVLPDAATWPLARHDRDVPILLPLFRHIIGLLAQKPPGWEELTHGALRQALLAFIVGSGSAHDHVPEEHPLVAAVQAYVREQWSDDELPPITLGDLARAVGVSKVHLTRVFNAELGVPPVDALRRLRLDRSAGLLARTNLPVGDIARQCGFADPFHFSRLFRALYGVSPRHVRERGRRGIAPPILGLARVRQFGTGLT